MGDFFKTIGKWPVFLAGSILSNILGTFDWMTPLWRNPVVGTLTVLALVGGVVGVGFTLRAMLGLG